MKHELYTKEIANLLKANIKKSKLHWSWTGEVEKGSAVVTINDTKYLVLDVVWLISKKDVVNNNEVVQSICNKEDCINPEHLSKTIYLENDNEAELSEIFSEEPVRDVE